MCTSPLVIETIKKMFTQGSIFDKITTLACFSKDIFKRKYLFVSTLKTAVTTPQFGATALINIKMPEVVPTIAFTYHCKCQYCVKENNVFIIMQIVLVLQTSECKDLRTMATYNLQEGYPGSKTLASVFKLKNDSI